MVFLVENKKSGQYHWILHIQIRLATKFSLKLTILTFWTKFAQKGKLHHWILHIRISLGIKFHLKLTILIFWTKFAQKECSSQKRKKWTPSLNSAYLSYASYEISTESDNFELLHQICLKRVFTIKNGKSEHHHWILHIRISLSSKLHLKLGFNFWDLIFWTKFAKKAISGWKRKKVNNIIEFCIIELH